MFSVLGLLVFSDLQSYFHQLKKSLLECYKGKAPFTIDVFEIDNIRNIINVSSINHQIYIARIWPWRLTTDVEATIWQQWPVEVTQNGDRKGI